MAERLRRFLLFGGRSYYPGGGWEDFLASFDDIGDAQTSSLTHPCDWWHVIDGETGETVASTY